jgi:hypothetical protein
MEPRGLVGGLAMDKKMPSTIERKSDISFSKCQARKEVREVKQLTINGVFRAREDLKIGYKIIIISLNSRGFGGAHKQLSLK